MKTRRGPRSRPASGSRRCSNHYCLDRRIFLLAPRHNVQHAVWQWALQLQRLEGFALQPEVELLGCGQDHRHGLGMDGRDDGVGFSGQEPEQLVLALDWRAVWPAPAPPSGPKPRKANK